MKMRQIITNLFLLTGFWMLLSCEKDATIPLPKSDKKLVLTCFLSPDEDTIIARLSWTKPIFGMNDNISLLVADATVQIAGPDGMKTLIWDPIADDYRIPQNQIQIRPGESYTVSAQTPSGSKVKGTCKVPLRYENQFQTQVVDSAIMYSDGIGKDRYSYIIKAIFQPAGPGESWFRLGAYQRDGISNFPGEPTQEFWTFLDYELDTRFFKSTGPSINPYSAVISTFPRSFENEDSAQVFKFVLTQGDKTYYDFHESVFNFEGDNPFAEPVRLFTNVENGLGVVCSYLKESKTIRK